jgi:hypothetical protein
MLGRRNSNVSLLLAAAVAAVGMVSAACNESSNDVTGVGGGAGMAAVNITGTWSGTFRSGAPGCSAVPMVATFSQSGDKVTGNVMATSCGLTGGHFNGTMTGTQLTGNVGMQGCTGGAVSGTVAANGSSISFSMDDLKKPLVTGDQVVAPGGDVTLSR